MFSEHLFLKTPLEGFFCSCSCHSVHGGQNFYVLAFKSTFFPLLPLLSWKFVFSFRHLKVFFSRDYAGREFLLLQPAPLLKQHLVRPFKKINPYRNLTGFIPTKAHQISGHRNFVKTFRKNLKLTPYSFEWRMLQSQDETWSSKSVDFQGWTNFFLDARLFGRAI